jgi:KDO2-lipid IV(A) lauroyltransferase
MTTYYLLRVGLLVARVLPQRVAYWLCSLVGNVAFYLNGSARRAVLDNLAHVFGPRANPHRLRRVGRGVFRNTVKNYYELLYLPRLSPADLQKRITLQGLEHITEARKGGRGVIIFSGHIGNFNLAAQMAAVLGFPSNVIAEQMHPEKLHDLMNGLRERFGLKLIPLGPEAVRGIARALRANEVLGLAADRDLTDNSVPVEFFGETTELPSGLAALSLRLRTPVVPIHVIRQSNDRSIVKIYPALKFAQTGDRDRDAAVGAQQIARILETFIRRTPDQWVVLQPVWPDPPAALAPGPSPKGGGEPADPPEAA